MARSVLARRAGIDTPRLAHYESGRVALPYHVGAKLVRELDLCQRWLATGVGPIKGCYDVEPFVEELIPKTMRFSEAFDRVLFADIAECQKIAAELHLVHASADERHLFGRVGSVGEHPMQRQLRLEGARAMARVQDLLAQLQIGTAFKLILELHQLLNPYSEAVETEVAPLQSIAEVDRAELQKKYAEKLKGWVSPGRAGKRAE